MGAAVFVGEGLVPSRFKFQSGGSWASTNIVVLRDGPGQAVAPTVCTKLRSA